MFHKRWHIAYNQTVERFWLVADFTVSHFEFDWRTSEMEKDRYALAKPQVDRLLHLLVELDEDSLKYYLYNLTVFEEKVNGCQRFVIIDADCERAGTDTCNDVVVGDFQSREFLH